MLVGPTVTPLDHCCSDIHVFVRLWCSLKLLSHHPPRDPPLDPRCSRVQVVGAAVDMELLNFTGSDLLRDAAARDLAVGDVIPEPEIPATAVLAEVGSDTVLPEPEADWTRNGAAVGWDNVVRKPEMSATGRVAVRVDDVTPEAVVDEQQRCVMDEGACQYLYDDIAGHYSPAGRGYPHGFQHQYRPATVPRPRLTTAVSPAPQSANDDDDDDDDFRHTVA